MNVVKVIFSGILAVVLFSSCEEVIDLNLNDSDPKVVITGSVTNQYDTVAISISYTSDYFNPSPNAAIRGASVTISDDLDNNYDLTEATPGKYISVFEGVPGRTYTLTVQTENQTYTALSTMPLPVPVDSLWLSTTNWYERVYYMMNCQIKDPADVTNYYFMRAFRNDTVISSESYFHNYTDKYFNGLYSVLSVWTDTRVPANDLYRVELFNIDYQFNEYLDQFRRIVDESDFSAIAASTPANPETNLSNGAIGYFTACSISEKSFTQ